MRNGYLGFISNGQGVDYFIKWIEVKQLTIIIIQKVQWYGLRHSVMTNNGITPKQTDKSKSPIKSYLERYVKGWAEQKGCEPNNCQTSSAHTIAPLNHLSSRYQIHEVYMVAEHSADP
ncbi:hypothetical protein CR513_24318, partial [Mucuna pruriens]